MFNGLINLQYLYLQNNQFITLETYTFNGLTNLRELYLNNNYFSIESQFQLRNVFGNIKNTNMCFIYLIGNPIFSTITNKQCLCGNKSKCTISPNSFEICTNDVTSNTSTTTIINTGVN